MKRFFEKVDKLDDCWIWKGAIRGKSGYGCIRVKRKLIGAHRLSWIIHYGEIPEGILVCHTCDNRKCVNPEHLFLGTQKVNIQDALKKGRLKIPEGVRFEQGHIPKTSLIQDRVEAKKLKNSVINRKTSLKKLAEELNYPYQLLRDISCNRVFKNI